MNKVLLLLVSISLSVVSLAQYDWDETIIGPEAGSGKYWELQSNVSDDFNYNQTFSSGNYNQRSNFGSGKWYNFYHNSWDGPGTTYWNTGQVSVDGDNLVITVAKNSSTSKMGMTGVTSGCVTSNNRVTYPVYVESAVSVANISLASCFWLLSGDDYEEIDIIENYAGVPWFNTFTHISHHSFVRTPFTDYQPKDHNSWYPISEISAAGGWGTYCWNSGERRYMIMGVNWIGPKHWEYYINSELVRVMYYNAIATKINGTWEYTYYNSLTTNGNGYKLPTNAADGYTAVTEHTTSSTYSFATLQAASNASNGYSVIDPGWFQGGDDTDIDGNGITQEAKGFTRELDIIINMESQEWLANDHTPSDADLADPAKNQMKVDWVRVYKPTTNVVNATEVRLNTNELTAYNGAEFELSALVLPVTAGQTVSWKSLTTGIATVNSDGLVSCIGAGNAAIVATSNDGTQTDTCYVNILAEPIKGSLTIDNPTQLTSASFENDGSIQYTCSFETATLHTVDGNGIKFLLEEVDPSGAVVKTKLATQQSAAFQTNGSATGSIRLRGITPTADLSAGNYYRLNAAYYQITNMGENSDTVYVTSTVDNINIIAAGTGINDAPTTTIDVYPNPSQGIVNIISNENAALEIFTLIGQKVVANNIAAYETQIINLSEYGAGIYIIKVNDAIERIVIE